MADEDMDSAPADNATGLATAMIIVTSIMLIAAVVIVNSVSTDQYGYGLF